MKVLIKKLDGTVLEFPDLTKEEIESLSFARKLVLYEEEMRKPRQTKLTEFMEI